MSQPLDKVVCPVVAAAERHGAKPALQWTTDGVEQVLSFDDLNRVLNNLGERLRWRGAVPRRVALLVDDPAVLLVHMWALFRLGVEVCLPSARLPDAVVLNMLRDARATLLLTDRELLRGPDDIGIKPAFGIQAGSVLQSAQTPPINNFRSAGTIVFTSGSTGRAKGVLHNIAAHMYSAVGSSENIPVRAGDRWALTLPQYHVSGISISFRCFMAGATVVIPNAHSQLSAELRRIRATHVSLVYPQLLALLADDASGTGSNGLHVLVGGSAVPVSALDRAHKAGYRVYATYGLTEMASQVTTTNGSGEIEELRTAGRLLAHREMKLDTAGQILVRGATRFEGYVSEKGLETPFDVGGWFKTGDRGSFDREGRLVVAGRLDRMFISGGENIHPEEIEAAISSVPAVRAVVVVPVADEEFGARPVAFIDPATDRPLLDTVVDTVLRHLPRYCVPVRFMAFPSDAETAISKKDYVALAEHANRANQTDCDVSNSRHTI